MPGANAAERAARKAVERIAEDSSKTDPLDQQAMLALVDTHPRGWGLLVVVARCLWCAPRLRYPGTVPAMPGDRAAVGCCRAGRSDLMGKTAATSPDPNPQQVDARGAAQRAVAMTPQQKQAQASAVKAARALLNKLRDMDAVLLAALMRLPGTAELVDASEVVPVADVTATRLHALQDAGRMLDEVEAFLDRAGASPARPLVAPDAASAGIAPAQLAARIGELCAQAGFSGARVQKLAADWVGRVAAYMRGFDGHLIGKARQRSLTTTRTSARRLSTALHKAPHFEVAGALVALLDRLQANADQLLHEIAMRPPGRTEVPDPVAYGAEGVLAIWLRHHERAPTLSRNRSGFLAFGTGLLELAAAQAVPGGLDWIARTTLETALRGQLESHRRGQQPAD